MLGRWLFLLGLGLAVVGALLWFGDQLFPWLGRLPGDFRVEWGNGTFFFPLATSIIVSLILTLLLNILIRFLNR